MKAIKPHIAKDTVVKGLNMAAKRQNEQAVPTVDYAEAGVDANNAPIFKRVDGREQSSLSFIRPSQLAESGTTGVILQGIYEGSVPNTMTKKDDYKFKLENGNTVILNGAGNLGYQMGHATIGQLVRVSYNGKLEIKKGPMKGKESHNFTVEGA